LPNVGWGGDLKAMTSITQDLNGRQIAEQFGEGLEW
jgi:hypothetical protein